MFTIYCRGFVVEYFILALYDKTRWRLKVEMKGFSRISVWRLWVAVLLLGKIGIYVGSNAFNGIMVLEAVCS